MSKLSATAKAFTFNPTASTFVPSFTPSASTKPPATNPAPSNPKKTPNSVPVNNFPSSNNSNPKASPATGLKPPTREFIPSVTAKEWTPTFGKPNAGANPNPNYQGNPKSQARPSSNAVTPSPQGSNLKENENSTKNNAPSEAKANTSKSDLRAADAPHPPASVPPPVKAAGVWGKGVGASVKSSQAFITDNNKDIMKKKEEAKAAAQKKAETERAETAKKKKKEEEEREKDKGKKGKGKGKKGKKEEKEEKEAGEKKGKREKKEGGRGDKGSNNKEEKKVRFDAPHTLFQPLNLTPFRSSLPTPFLPLGSCPLPRPRSCGTRTRFEGRHLEHFKLGGKGSTRACARPRGRCSRTRGCCRLIYRCGGP